MIKSNHNTKDARVLIIEHEDALRVILFTILRHQPLEVDTAANVDEAYEKLMSCDYALMLIDMSLPKGEAEELLRRFRRDRSEATTFVIAVRDPNSDEPVDPDIVNALLNKPLEIDTLSEVVRECAFVIPPPEEPLPCAPAESDLRSRFDRSGSYYSN